jgi:hypothetical protein
MTEPSHILDPLEPWKIEQDGRGFLCTFGDGWTQHVQHFEVAVAARYQHQGEALLGPAELVRSLARAYRRDHLERRAALDAHAGAA